MFKLIKIEASKFSVKGELIVFLGITLAIAALTFFISKDAAIPINNTGLYQFVEFITTNAFFVFGAVLMSKYFVGEFENKTIQILFSYPINRKKIMIAKIIFVSIIIVMATVMSYLIILLLFYVMAYLTDVSMNFLTIKYIYDSFTGLVLNVVILNIAHTLTLYIGLKYKSSAAIIVASIVLLLILTPLMRLDSYAIAEYIPIMIGGLGLIGLYFNISTIDQVDLL